MNIRFMILALSLFILGGVFTTPSQVPPNAYIIDEYGHVACDDMLARIDNFLGQLQRDPDARGLVVIMSSTTTRRHAAFHTALIESAVIKNWKSHKNRIRYLRSNSNTGFRVQYWGIPRGAPSPPIANVDMSYALPPDIKPFMFSWEYEVDDGICPIIDDTKLLAEFMVQNPKSRLNIVIRGWTRKEAEATLDVLVKRYGISRARTRVFFASKKAPNEPIVEYWFVP